MNKIGKLLLILLVSTAMTSLVSCKQKTQKTADGPVNPDMHQVSVVEVLQTSAYTYLKVFENNQEYWLAVQRQEAAKGDVYYFMGGMEMKDFKSKELNRTFESVFFVDQLSTQPIAAAPAQQATPQGKQPLPQDPSISVEPANGSISIATVFGKRDEYDGKTVLVRGQVVKFNAEIMDKNWVHIQDGSIDGGNYDLTITTKETVTVGDVVTFKGNLALKKDFGAGYFYEVILEDAAIVAKGK